MPCPPIGTSLTWQGEWLFNGRINAGGFFPIREGSEVEYAKQLSKSGAFSGCLICNPLQQNYMWRGGHVKGSGG